LIDDELDVLMPELAAVGVDGPKGVGKTATGLQRAATVLSLDDPVALSIVRADPVRALGRPRPILVDEWQRAPEVWDHVRRAVDDGAPASSFLLTGSATPAVGATAHSGAGRIVSLRMRPMALSERDLAEPTVSLASLLEGGRPGVHGESRLTLADYAHEIEASGFPGIRSLAINVDTYNGNVTLKGDVKNAAQRATAEKLARKVRSVKSVRNELAVKG